MPETSSLRSNRCLNRCRVFLVAVLWLFGQLPTGSEAVCCHGCRYHGQAFLAYNKARLYNNARKFWLGDIAGKPRPTPGPGETKKSWNELWDMLKYNGPYCTLNECDGKTESKLPLLNRCGSLTQKIKGKVKYKKV